MMEMGMDQILDKHDVCKVLGISERTFGATQKEKGFPKSFRWSATTEPRWLYSDVVKFIAENRNGDNGD